MLLIVCSCSSRSPEVSDKYFSQGSQQDEVFHDDASAENRDQLLYSDDIPLEDEDEQDDEDLYGRAARLVDDEW